MNTYNTETIAKNNIQMILFMGGLYSAISKLWGIGNAEYISIGGKTYVKAIKHYTVEQIMYDRSFDWLMPIGAKCIKLAEDNEMDEWVSGIYNAVSCFDILILHKELSNFIKFFNSNSESFPNL